MRIWSFVASVLAALVSCAGAPAQAESAACPVTVLGPGEWNYGDEFIAVNLTGMTSGTIGPPHTWITDGSLRVKLGWRRGVAGKPLTIEGRRLDAVAPPLRAWIPNHGDIGGQTAVLFFPVPDVGRSPERLAITR